MNYKGSKFSRKAGPILDQRDRVEKVLVFGTRRCQLRSVDVGSWQMVEDGKFNNLPASVLDDLIDAEIVVPSGEDELATVL